MARDPELIRVESLSHVFRDGSKGLDSLDMRIREGEFLVLAGRNGSGKSLLVRHMIGLARPSSGRVLYRGISVESDPVPARLGIGLVFQDAEAQMLGQTLLEDASFGPANLRLGRDEVLLRAREALALVGLADKERRRPDSLSGGERRGLAIAGVLAMRPECVILDEPFANLDFPAIGRLLSIVVDLHASGRTIVLLTHELEKTLAHATRLAVLEKGRLAYEGPPDGLERGRFEDYGLMNPWRYGSRLEDLTWMT